MITGMLLFLSICLLFLAFLVYIKHKCKHKFKVIQKYDITLEGESKGFGYVLQCEKCGKITKEEM